MRRPLVAHDDAAGALRVPLAFASHQHFHTPVQAVDLVLLTGHDVRQVIDAAQQMRHLFFEFFHGLHLGRFARVRNGPVRLAPRGRIR